VCLRVPFIRIKFGKEMSKWNFYIKSWKVHIRFFKDPHHLVPITKMTHDTFFYKNDLIYVEFDPHIEYILLNGEEMHFCVEQKNPSKRAWSPLSFLDINEKPFFQNSNIVIIFQSMCLVKWTKFFSTISIVVIFYYTFVL